MCSYVEAAYSSEPVGGIYTAVQCAASKNEAKVGVAGPRFAAAVFSPIGAGVAYLIARTTSHAAARLIAMEIHCEKYAAIERVVHEESVTQNGSLFACFAAIHLT